MSLTTPPPFDDSAFRITQATEYMWPEIWNAKIDWMQLWHGYLSALAGAYSTAIGDAGADLRNEFTGLLSDATSARDHISGQLASIGLPEISAENAEMLMRVKPDGSRYEVVHPSQLFQGWMESLAVNVGGTDYPVFSASEIILPAFGEYDLNSPDDYNRFVEWLSNTTQAVSDAVSDAQQHSTSASGQVSRAKYWADQSQGWAESIGDDVRRSRLNADTAYLERKKAESAAIKASSTAVQVDSLRQQTAQYLVAAQTQSQQAASAAVSAAASAASSSQSQAASHNSAMAAASNAERASDIAADIKQHAESYHWTALLGVLSNAAALIRTQDIILRGASA